MKRLHFILVIGILLSAAIVNHYLSKPDISLSRKSLNGFPKVLGDWTAIDDQKIDDRSMKILQVDDYLMRSYRNSGGEIIGLYIGYFKSQREGKGIHSPRQCLPGAGWAPLATATWKMDILERNTETIPANQFVMGKGLERQLFHFWYQGRGRVYTSEYWNKIYLIWDGLIQRRTDGALVRVNGSVNGNLENSVKTQTEFIKKIFPLIKEY